jgi:multidrug efflux pump subunit AcrA (membrane-fusion protein)
MKALRHLRPSLRGGRMVRVMEVSGYAFLALMIAFFIFAWKKQLPATASGQGRAQPVVRELRAARDTIVLANMATHGDRVDEGDPVLEVTDDPVEVGLLRVRAMLEIEASESADSREQTARAKLRDLFTQGELQLARRPLASPIDGWVISRERNYGQWVPAGNVLFSVADFLSLQVTAEITADQKADRVEVGQRARVWFFERSDDPVTGEVIFVELSDDPVTGEVVALTPGVEGGQVVTVESSPGALPPEVVERARQAHFEDTMKDWRGSVAVTVGEERLLNQIRQPSQGP